MTTDRCTDTQTDLVTLLLLELLISAKIAWPDPLPLILPPASVYWMFAKWVSPWHPKLINVGLISAILWLVSAGLPGQPPPPKWWFQMVTLTIRNISQIFCFFVWATIYLTIQGGRRQSIQGVPQQRSCRWQRVAKSTCLTVVGHAPNLCDDRKRVTPWWRAAACQNKIEWLKAREDGRTSLID